jgi:tRNA U38,U39,U40 pseudouridine synthase TruA
MNNLSTYIMNRLNKEIKDGIHPSDVASVLKSLHTRYEHYAKTYEVEYVEIESDEQPRLPGERVRYD